MIADPAKRAELLKTLRQQVLECELDRGELFGVYLQLLVEIGLLLNRGDPVSTIAALRATADSLEQQMTPRAGVAH